MTDWPGDVAPLPHQVREDRLAARLAGMVGGDLTFASSYTDGAGNTRVHYARCEPCMFGAHSGGWHSWAGPEDRIHALKAGKPGPIDKRCACECAERDPEPYPEPEFDDDLATDQPCATCGEAGACGYDAEGRPMIHATWLDDDAEDDR